MSTDERIDDLVNCESVFAGWPKEGVKLYADGLKRQKEQAGEGAVKATTEYDLTDDKPEPKHTTMDIRQVFNDLMLKDMRMKHTNNKDEIL